MPDIQDVDLGFGDIEFQVLRIPIAGHTYLLSEASGAVARKYRNYVTDHMVMSKDGKVSHIKDLAGVEPFLVSLCLFYDQPDQDNPPVPQSVVEEWPSQVQTALFNKVKEISPGLEERTLEKDQLLSALALADSPIQLDALRSWLATLPKDEYGRLQRWLLDVEASAKN